MSLRDENSIICRNLFMTQTLSCSSYGALQLYLSALLNKQLQLYLHHVLSTSTICNSQSQSNTGGKDSTALMAAATCGRAFSSFLCVCSFYSLKVSLIYLHMNSSATNYYSCTGILKQFDFKREAATNKPYFKAVGQVSIRSGIGPVPSISLMSAALASL
jgi:hypothetical protein